MKDVFIKVLLIGITLAAFAVFVAAGTGLWGDLGTVEGRKDTTVAGATIPNN